MRVRFVGRRLVRQVAAGLAAITLAATTVSAAGPSIAVSTVGGQAVQNGSIANPVSGTVNVTGTTSPNGATTPAAKPLVADAGDSSFVKIGQPALLVGAGFGGVEPYTFAWTAAAGTIEGADAPTSSWNSVGLAAGTYTVSLRVTDQRGVSATDTVKISIFDPVPVTIFNQSKNDALPGVLSIGVDGQGYVEFQFTVPAGLPSMDVTASWTLAAQAQPPVAAGNDYDMRLVDPTGVGIDGPGSLPGNFETIGVGSPMPGTWKAILEKYAVVTDTVTVKVTTFTARDPRPTASTTGPYKFLTGATQRLTGSVSGGTTPVSTGWDTDGDGTLDKSGNSITTNLPAGRTLVTFKATDAAGFERRQTTSVLVGDADRLAKSTVAITVVGVADSGINPYHFEFSAATYPDPDVLALTRNFTRHPSEYITGYPASATALPITLGQGYYPAKDQAVWSNVEVGKLYWIPGTKIIGAIDAGDSSAVNADPDNTRIVDDDGHGTGSSSVSTGNRYGYCPTCLLMFTESLDTTYNESFSWVDITSHSFGTVGGVPLGLVFGEDLDTKAAAERGQTVLFAAGNGVGNAFDVPQITYGSGDTGNDWTITVGAIRRDNQRAIVGDGIPVEISAWGDGNLPSACRTGTVGQCAFGGTSAATPYTAGIFGTVLTRVRQAIGDPLVGQRPGQVVAEGTAIPGSIFLDDGKLTRAELRDAVLKTAFPLNQDNTASMFPYPLTAPYINAETNVLFEGYGAATPEGAKRAVDVILGKAVMPDRSFEDQFMAASRAVKDTLYGGFDRDGDGDEDFEGLAGTTLNQADFSSLDYAVYALKLASYAVQPAYAVEPLVPQYAVGQNSLTYYLHQHFTAEPGVEESCAAHNTERYMDNSNTEGDLECFDARATSVPAAYRPLGIYASSNVLDAPLPAGSDVYATIYIASVSPAVIRPTGVLVATDREIGTGSGAFAPVLGSGPGPGYNAQGNELPDGGACAALGELCWTKFDLSFKTTRPAFTGEQLTFQLQLLGAQGWAFGHEAGHASKVAIVAAPMPPTGLDFGVTIDQPAAGSRVNSGSTVVAGGRATFPDLGSDPTGAGDHPSENYVEVSLDSASFSQATTADLDEASGSWSANLGVLANGDHTLYARARMGATTSAVTSVAFSVAPDARVEWQIVKQNAAPDPSAWHTASGVGTWSFSFATSSYGNGQRTLVVRLVEGGLETARTSVRLRLS
ncbi:MAG TPA: S8 family serine peptidase [Acidimicrobiales bacterium]|nr:S8 family serine peptidase [Acidimicrobiales bacterium]